MLQISSDIVCELILKIREFHAKEGVTITEADLDIPAEETDPLQILADHQNDLTVKEIVSTISDLEPDQQVDLLALMYLGRGDYNAEEWDEAIQEAKINWRPNLVKTFLENPQVSDFWEEGLSMLNYSCE